PTGASNSIYNVSVTEKQVIQIVFMSQLKEGTISLLKSSDRINFQTFKTYDAKSFPENITVIDSLVDVASKIYYYQITHKDVCDYVIPQDSSLISNSILLNVSENSIESELNWNPYNTFSNGVGQYHVYKQY